MGIKKFASILVLSLGILSMTGCEKALNTVRQTGSTSDPELEVAALAANENRNQTGLYLLNYTNIPSGDRFTGIQLASGRLLSSADGRFLFHQSSSEPTKNFSVHFDPNRDLTIVFPAQKKAMRTPALILQSPDAIPLLAGYDGLRLLLGQGNVWSDPSRSQFDVGRGGAKVEQPGRSFSWRVDFESGDFLFPIERLVAKAGMRDVLTVEKATLSYESLDYANRTGDAFPGNDVRGSQINVSTWKFDFARAPSTTEIQINPSSEQEAEDFLKMGKLDAPTIPTDYRTEEITLVNLMNWLNIRP